MHVLIDWQLSKQCIRWPVSPDRIAGSGIETLSSSVFEVIRWQVATFQIIAGSSSNFLKWVWNKLCSWAALLTILISKWPRALKSTGFYIFFYFCHHSHASVTLYVYFLCSDWWKFDRLVQAENFNMQHLETCLLKAEADRVLRHLTMFLTIFFYWRYKMKYSCYQDSSATHAWLVYCPFGWEIHRLSKSLEIWFRMAFSKMILLTCPY